MSGEVTELRLCLHGSPPYGFRIIGGDGDPVTVARVRQGSKAAQAGLIEGDVVLVINDFICKNLSYDSVFGLTEYDDDQLSLIVLRGRDNVNVWREACEKFRGRNRMVDEEEIKHILKNKPTFIKKKDNNFENFAFQFNLPNSSTTRNISIDKIDERSKDEIVHIPLTCNESHRVIYKEVSPSRILENDKRSSYLSSDGNLRFSNHDPSYNSNTIPKITHTFVSQNNFRLKESLDEKLDSVMNPSVFFDSPQQTSISPKRGSFQTDFKTDHKTGFHHSTDNLNNKYDRVDDASFRYSKQDPPRKNSNRFQAFAKLEINPKSLTPSQPPVKQQENSFILQSKQQTSYENKNDTFSSHDTFNNSASPAFGSLKLLPKQETHQSHTQPNHNHHPFSQSNIHEQSPQPPFAKQTSAKPPFTKQTSPQPFTQQTTQPSFKQKTTSQAPSPKPNFFELSNEFQNKIKLGEPANFEYKAPSYQPPHQENETRYQRTEQSYRDYDPNYKSVESNSTNYVPNSKEYKPSYLNTQSDYKDYQPTHKDYQPTHKDYQPIHKDYQPIHNDNDQSYQGYGVPSDRHYAPQNPQSSVPMPPPAPSEKFPTNENKGMKGASLNSKEALAKNMALSVMSDANRNSKGQKLFLMKRQNSEKYTIQSPDPPMSNLSSSHTRSFDISKPHKSNQYEPQHKFESKNEVQPGSNEYNDPKVHHPPYHQPPFNQVPRPHNPAYFPQNGYHQPSNVYPPYQPYPSQTPMYNPPYYPPYYHYYQPFPPSPYHPPFPQPPLAPYHNDFPTKSHYQAANQYPPQPYQPPTQIQTENDIVDYCDL